MTQYGVIRPQCVKQLFHGTVSRGIAKMIHLHLNYVCVFHQVVCWNVDILFTKVFANLNNALKRAVRNKSNGDLDILYVILQNIFRTFLATGNHDAYVAIKCMLITLLWSIISSVIMTVGQPWKYMG